MAQNNMLNTPEPFAIGAGGTGVASVTTAPTASAWSGWDANKNHTANNHIASYTTTATAAGTTTLTVGSTWQQFFTGTTTQTVTLPVTSTLVLGQSFYIVNNSTGNVTVNSSGGNAVQVMTGSTTLLVTCILTSGTTAASWATEYVGAASGGTVNSGTINQLAWYAATGNAVSGLATANGGVLVTSNTGVPSILAGSGTTNTILQATASGTPAWSTATYPATTTINQLLYSSAANVVGGVTAGNNGVLVSSNTGVPSWNTSLGQGLSVASSVLSVGGANNVPFNTGKGLQDNNGNSLLLFTVTASAVNYVNLTNNSTGNKPILAAAGTDTNIILQLSGKGTGGAAVQGTSTNDNSASGYVGEYVSSTILVGSAVSLSTGVSKDVTSISLTAGDWDVWGLVIYNPAGTTTTSSINNWISSTSATVPTAPNNGGISFLNIAHTAGQSSGIPIGMQRFSLSTTTTIFLSCQAAFAVSTMSAYGFIGARRVR